MNATGRKSKSGGALIRGGFLLYLLGSKMPEVWID